LDVGLKGFGGKGEDHRCAPEAIGAPDLENIRYANKQRSKSISAKCELATASAKKEDPVVVVSLLQRGRVFIILGHFTWTCHS
jgi:hypothetical protein